MDQTSPLIIRADSGLRIGAGHVMRCLALAQKWLDQERKVIFITACESDSVRQRLTEEGFEIVPVERAHPDPSDWRCTSEVLAQYPGAWTVLDGYHFDPVYHRLIKEAGHSLLVIDDMAHLEHYYADILLNQNLHASTLNYSCEPYTRLLLGTRYALLRREFLKWREWKRVIPRVARKILVTMGGGDPENVTMKVLSALKQAAVEEIEIKVVVGGENTKSNYDVLCSLSREIPHPVYLVRNVANMADLMAWADIAISSAGSTSWEMAFMGLPGFLIVLADNQIGVAELQHAAGIAVNLGWYSDLSFQELVRSLKQLLTGERMRIEMIKRGQELVDGSGSARTLACMSMERSLRVRQACENDCLLLWRWANDHDVREFSFSSRPISWEAHLNWFRKKISSPECTIYIAITLGGVPIGQVRFDREQDEAVISASIDAGYRNKGYGSTMIRLASKSYFEATETRVINAYIKQDNVLSERAFKRSGFESCGRKIFQGNLANHMSLQRSNLDV